MTVFIPHDEVWFVDDAFPCMVCLWQGDEAEFKLCANGATVTKIERPHTTRHIIMVQSAEVLVQQSLVSVLRAFPAAELKVRFKSESDAQMAADGLVASQQRVIRSLYSCVPEAPPKWLDLLAYPRNDDFSSLLAASYAVVGQWFEFAHGRKGRKPSCTLYWVELICDGVDGQGSGRPHVLCRCFDGCRAAVAPDVTFTMPRCPEQRLLAGQTFSLHMQSALGSACTHISFFSVEEADLWQQIVCASYGARGARDDGSDSLCLTAKVEKMATKCMSASEDPLLLVAPDSDDADMRCMSSIYPCHG